MFVQLCHLLLQLQQKFVPKPVKAVSEEPSVDWKCYKGKTNKGKPSSCRQTINNKVSPVYSASSWKTSDSL